VRAFARYAAASGATTLIISVIAFAGSPVTDSHASGATITYATGLSTVRGTLTDPDGRQWVSDEVHGFCRLTADDGSGAPLQIEDVATGGGTLTCLGGTSPTRRGANIPGAPALSNSVALVPDVSAGSDAVYRARWNHSTGLFDPSGNLTLQDAGGDLQPTAVSVGPDGAAYVSLGNARSVIRIQDPASAQPHLSTVATLPTGATGIAAAATIKGSTAQTRGFVATSSGLRAFVPPAFGARSTQDAWPSFSITNPVSLTFDSRTRYLVAGYSNSNGTAIGRFAIDTGRVETPWVTDPGVVTGLGTYSAGDQAGVDSSSLLRVASDVAAAGIVPRHDFNGDNTNDLLTVDGSGYLWLYPGNGKGGWLARTLVTTGLKGYQMVGTGDLNGDGTNDMILVDAGGYLWLYPGNGNGGLQPRSLLTSGLRGYTLLGPGDFTGDNVNDVIVRDGSGYLWLYAGNGHGGLVARVQIGNGWKGLTLVAPGDFNGDHTPDVLARDGNGDLWLYPGNGHSGWLSRVKVGAGWTGYTLVGPGDFNGDNTNDVLARDGSGYLWLYPGNGSGSWLSRVLVGSGWKSYALVP
jgi:hypothetical protein